MMGPIGQLADAVLDVCEALASTGRPALSPRQRDTLQQRARQVGDLGLGALADAVSKVLSVVRARAASSGRSRSKPATHRAANCCASAADGPLPQASTLPPLVTHAKMA